VRTQACSGLTAHGPRWGRCAYSSTICTMLPNPPAKAWTILCARSAGPRSAMKAAVSAGQGLRPGRQGLIRTDLHLQVGRAGQQAGTCALGRPGTLRVENEAIARGGMSANTSDAACEDAFSLCSSWCSRSSPSRSQAGPWAMRGAASKQVSHSRHQAASRGGARPAFISSSQAFWPTVPCWPEVDPTSA
jgi:hypothetical protein